MGRGGVTHRDKRMNESQSSSPVMRFGTFEVNLHSREVRKHGMRIRLEEKPFQILEMLLDRAGQVVTRKTLRERLWPDTLVRYDHCLNTAVNKLPNFLANSPPTPQFAATLPPLTSPVTPP